MKNKELKKIQHYANRAIRNLNKKIENDELFLGRYVIQQIGRKYLWNDTYHCLTIYLRFGDKKTGKYIEKPVPIATLHSFIEEKISRYLNFFIMEHCCWMTEPVPEHKIDYRNISFIPKEKLEWRLQYEF